MYDAGKVITGLIIFLGLLTFPIYYGIITGTAFYRPEPEPVVEEEQCIEPIQYMIPNHMTLLANWMESVVHQGERIYIATDGEEWEISLIGTCLGCHVNKAEFCDVCHGYVGIELVCWDCHTPPEEQGES
ncbi:sulfate reduction electron transfer complex DsrMKJOP subunit DsrJ [Dehalococcoidales bacterium]|nr:sulfate reduction electron transfer complex DsrMKJOP subunit DsrJ [Dehalococcoidales bacterium]